MTHPRTALVAALAFLLGGCSDAQRDEPAPDAGDTESLCTAESQCSGCTSCLEACECQGGTERRCALECAEEPDGSASDGSNDLQAPLVETLVIDAFDIPPGEEFFRCQNFRNPFGRDVAVLQTESFMTSGSHHMFVFQGGSGSDGELETCGGLDFGPFVHSTQRSQEKFRYPDGVGRFLGAEEGLRMQIHFLNPSKDTIHTEVVATLHATEAEDVEHFASYVFINTFGISVPPRSKGEASNSCGVSKDVNLLTASSHMHRHGTYFTARDSDGRLLYETDEWAEPIPWDFRDAPRELPAGSRIDIHCSYQNDTDQSLSFGESADNNEMCILTGSYFPAAPGESISCLF